MLVLRSDLLHRLSFIVTILQEWTDLGCINCIADFFGGTAGAFHIEGPPLVRVRRPGFHTGTR